MELTPGSTIVLYTDGLVEERGLSIDDGLERLRAIAAEEAEPEALCKAATARLVPEAPADDIAMIVARLPPVAERLMGTWPAQKEVLADVRLVLRRWLHAHGASDDEAYDIIVACQEACANAVEHAYAPGEEAFEVEAVRNGAVVEVSVHDRGQWRRARGTHRGRGMPMMEALMDSVHVQHTADGTVVVLRRTLGRERAT
jgi:anti-sigma regulatory factor (Ser/Thr protein kinase)